MELRIPRHKNWQEPSEAPYDQAFTQTELNERGWTVSMIRRHLGRPDAVHRHGFVKYRYNTRRVYEAEGTPTFQLDLLATGGVETMGLPWLSKYRSYIPAMMKAALEGKAERSDNPRDELAYREAARVLPPANKKHPPAPPPPPSNHTDNQHFYEDL